MSDVLFKAIYAKFPGSDLYTRVGGRLFLHEAPSAAPLPYVEYFLVSNQTDWDLADSTFEEAVIQFNLFSDKNSANQVNSMYEDLMKLYDWCTLSPTGSYTSLYMRRENAWLIRNVEEGVWMYSIQYRVMFQSMSSTSNSSESVSSTSSSSVSSVSSVSSSSVSVP